MCIIFRLKFGNQLRLSVVQLAADKLDKAKVFAQVSVIVMTTLDVSVFRQLPATARYARYAGWPGLGSPNLKTGALFQRLWL